MKKLILVLLTVLSVRSAFADNSVPHTINFQSVLRDDGGNLIPDGTITLNFKILDVDGTQLYQETQTGEVVRGAVNVMIGEGDIPGSDAATGGIPMNALDPSHGEKFVQYQIGTNQPIDPISIGSIPYAMWAEKSFGVVNEGVTTESIKNGTIKAEDLEPGSVQFSDIGGLIGARQLPVDVVHLSELTAHKDASVAHRADQIEFAQASSLFSLPTTTTSAPDRGREFYSVKDVLLNLDRQLNTRTTSHALTNIAIAHPNGNFPTTRLEGQITNAQIADRAITAEKLAVGVVGADSIADGTIGSSKITDDSVTSADIQNGTIRVEDIFQRESDPTSLDNRYINEESDAMRGPLYVIDPGTSAVTPPPVGTFDVGKKLRDHETRIQALGGANPCGHYYAYGSVSPFDLRTPGSGGLDTRYPNCNIERVSIESYGIDTGVYEWTIIIGPTHPVGLYLTFATATGNACSVSASPWYPGSSDTRQLHVLMHCPSGNGGFQFMVIQP